MMSFIGIRDRIGVQVLLAGSILAGGFGLVGCRGDKSAEPPVHLNWNMDFQYSYKAQERSDLFADGRAERPFVAGTVSRGNLKEDDGFYRGKAGAAYVKAIPLEVDLAVVQRGRDRFQIYCAVCHGKAGYGDGIVPQRGLTPPPSFHDPRLQTMDVGQIYETISNGIRTMPYYRDKIVEKDRWAIVAYVRALQVSQHASLKAVPQNVATEKGWVK